MATNLAATTSISTSNPSTWSDLSDDILRSILLLLTQTRDLLAFSSTCRSWRTSATSILTASPAHLFPPLLIRAVFHQHSRRRRRRTVSALQLVDPTIPTSTKRSPIEEPILSLPFLSSSHGHLLFLSREKQVLVVNFVTGRKITSPCLPMDCYHSSGSCLAQFTASVSSPKCLLIVLTVTHIVMWKFGSPDWVSYPLDVPLAQLRQMAVVGTRIWIVASVNRISCIDLNQDFRSNVHVVQWPQWMRDTIQRNWNIQLVECEGEILCVGFGTDGLEWETRVEVFGFDLYNPRLLVRKETIGNRAIFLGSAVDVPGCVCNDPQRWGGKPNCIYYAYSTKKHWSVLEVGGTTKRSLLDYQSNRARCHFPFWDFASILQ